MTQPLTDAINALTRYANEVTGQSDQTLSDAVRTLCDGYGGGSSETLTHSWDFTQSVTDSVGGMTAALYYCSTDSNGLHFINGGGYVRFPQDLFKANCRIEIDIANYDRQGTAHGRVLMFTNNNTGICYRNTGQWGAYMTNSTGNTSGWSMFAGATATSYFDGHTLKLVSDEYGIVEIYRDNELLATSQRPMTGFIEFGSSSDSAYNLTITAMRVYENV